MINDTIAAVSTPRGKGGVALIRISGDSALDCLCRCFIPVGAGGKAAGAELFAPRHAVYGKIVCEGKTVDTGIATFFESGHSYTGEATAEISCHGGTAVTEAVLCAVLAAGAVPAEAGEFTRRAFVNGRLSLTEAEAVGRLIDADTESRRRLAVNASLGLLAKKTGEIRSVLYGVMTSLYAAIDYPDEDITPAGQDELCAALSEAADMTARLLDTYKAGSAVANGVKTVICGVPNSGKSSLYNRLCGEEKAIVTDIAGTTRDTLEQTVDTGRVTLLLTDTAGVREAGDAVERAGVERARGKLAGAELVLFVTDGSRPFTQDEKQLAKELCGKPVIAVINKSDLPENTSLPEGVFAKAVRISAVRGDGITELCDAIACLCEADSTDATCDAVIWNARQKAALLAAREQLEAALEAAKAGTPADAVCTVAENALSSLSELDGRGVCEEIVAEIFSRFCVGK